MAECLEKVHLESPQSNAPDDIAHVANVCAENIDTQAASPPVKSRGIPVSKTVAKKILGYWVTNKTVGGRECVVYSPRDGTVGPKFCIPRLCGGREITDTFSGLLLRLCIRLAKRFGVRDELVPGDDREAYLAHAAKGGGIRPSYIVGPDEDGLIIVEDPTSLVIYDLDGATMLGHSTSEGLLVELLRGDALEKFLSCHAHVDQNATGENGDEVVISGSYCPASFLGGAPDSTFETLIAVEGLIDIDENVFKDRYNLYMVKPSAFGTTQTVGPRGFDIHEAPCGIPPGAITVVLDPSLDGEPDCAQDSELPPEQVDTCRSPGEDMQQKAVAALLWLGNNTQPFAPVSAYPGPVVNSLFRYANEICAYLKKGSKHDRLVKFVRSKSEPSKGEAGITLAAAAAEAQSFGLLPEVTFTRNDAAGKVSYRASHVLVFALTLMKKCSSIGFMTRDGVDSTFYWY